MSAHLLPDAATTLKDLRWRVYLACWNTLLALRRSPAPAAADRSRLSWVPPDIIQYICEHRRTFRHLVEPAQVHAGGWDPSTGPFETLDQAIRDRIEKGASWQDTPYYHQLLDDIASGHAPGGCASQIDLDQFCADIDRLISLVRQQGGPLAEGIASKTEGHDRCQPDAAILCNIDRHGRYLLQEGCHRLAIYKALAVDRVPVRVLVRHRKWRELRNTLTLLAQKQNWRLYQPAVHPDLEDIPALHSCVDRFQVIERHLDRRTGTMLDLGANLCYFCHKFEELGYQCIGIEADPLVGNLARRIRGGAGRSFQVIVHDLLQIADHPAIADKTFDVVLALNIFHHFLKTQRDYIRLREWLTTMSDHMAVLFFEPHNPHESQMRDAYRNYREEEFVEFIMRCTNFVRARCIYQSADNRQLYRLDRGPASDTGSRHPGCHHPDPISGAEQCQLEGGARGGWERRQLLRHEGSVE